jgi:hypothetical protein
LAGFTGKRQTPEDGPKEKPSRTDQARQIAKEYAKDQRAIIKKLPKPLSKK